MGTENTTYELEEFDSGVFFSEFWRRKPLLVRGGAPGFLGRRWPAEEFDAAEEAAVRGGHAIKERAGEVTFIEGVSSFHDDLSRRAADFGRLFGSPQTWFDTVRTHSSSGIGAHFDHSDNFVLQQSGTKDWYLAPPANIDQSDIARRMMNLPGVGGHQLPEDTRLHFEVAPDDLLYIPLFWLHSGVSRGESLSLSLVCPAVSLYSAVAPFLAKAMKAGALGYQPIPALHAGLSADERERTTEKVRAATRALLNRLGQDDLAEAVIALQEEHLRVPTA